ncbi:MAG: ATP-binding protein [Acidobacteria bacterium]|nr:ATP-binding protein [Acidobacteriota bacterium]
MPQDAQPEVADLNRELKALSQQLVEAHKMASLGRLLASVVHEINSPIGSILSNNEVILRSLDKLKEALGKEQTSDAADIIDILHSLAAVDKIACDRISSVIRGLKTFARDDEPAWQKVDLNENIRNTLKLAGCEFRRRVVVETDLGELPKVECHPHMLNQVFLNLLVNAGQAIEGEGKVTVQTRVENECVHIAISDTGHGIPPEYASRVFTPGFTTKPIGVGTGLGLSICRQIVVEKHGGRIDFESQPGNGTTFHIRIPIEQRSGGPIEHRS